MQTLSLDDVRAIHSRRRRNTAEQELFLLSLEMNGLYPQKAVPALIGRSRQTVHALLKRRTLETINVLGVTYVTGRSIQAWERDTARSKGGHGLKRGKIWQKEPLTT